MEPPAAATKQATSPAPEADAPAGAIARMKAYLRVDPLIDERKADYSPAQLGAFLKVMCLAARQHHRGRFRSMALLRGLLPSGYSRHVAFLAERGDIVEQDDGVVEVDGWDEWQEGDLSVGERMARMRARKRVNGGGAERTRKWRLRQQVFERDHYTCRYCLVSDYDRDWLVADHVIPEPDGPTTLENLVTACRPCNKRKGGRTPEEAGMPLLDVTRDDTPPGAASQGAA